MSGIVFWETQIEDSLVKKLENVLETEKSNQNGFYNGSCTINGFQTNTVHENQNYKFMLDALISYVPDGNNLCYRWFHLIDYDKSGKQEKHNHAATEDYSFIVYLNTCKEGGRTFFEVPNEPLFISKPVQGKLLFFPAHLDHWGEEVIEHKKVAVGALKFI